ncbi:MAG TPA: MYXO-CTERM sorting domain-containing protein [Kofleriaceae bacterium]
MMFVISGALAGTAGAFDFFEGTPHNGLSSRSFRLNALTSNRRALGVMLQHALDNALVSDEYIVRQLKDPGGRAMMVELVKCALDAGTLLVSEDQNHVPIARWRGEVGLCQSTPSSDSRVPVWDTSGPNEACQQIVTACITSRVNALKHSIPLSLRSETQPLAAVHDRVVTDRRFRESPPQQDPSLGWPVQSLIGPACPAGQPCSWASAYVGTCTPGQPVALAISDGAACGSAGIRVCGGIHGCYPATGPYNEPAGFPTAPAPHYSEFLAEKTGACTATPLTFTCPTALTTSGYYSVMVQPAAPGPIVDGWPDGGLHQTVVKVNIPGSGVGSYPAAERDVFGFLEGAFYGNLFKPDNLRRTCEVSLDGTKLDCTPGAVGTRGDLCTIVLTGSAPSTTGAVLSIDDQRDNCLSRDPTIPYTEVYACYSYEQQAENATDDEVSTAQFNARMCDLPPGSGMQCFPHPPKRCRYSDGRAGAGCDAIGTDGAYGRCPGQGTDTTIYRHIVTTHLNEVCDLTDDRTICTSLRRSTGAAQTPAGVPGVTHRPHGCGCSADADPTAVMPLLLAALAAAGALRLPARWRRAEARA